MLARVLSFLLFIIVGSASLAPASAQEKIKISWPDSKIGYVLYGPHAISTGGIAVDLGDGRIPPIIVPGTVRHLPFTEPPGQQQSPYFKSMSAAHNYKPSPMDEFLTTIVNNRIYILDSSGRVVEIPETLDVNVSGLHMKVVYNRSPKGLKVSYRRDNGKYHIFVYTANHTLHDLGVFDQIQHNSSFSIDYKTGQIQTEGGPFYLDKTLVTGALVIDGMAPKTLGKVDPLIEQMVVEPIQRLREIKADRLKLLADLKKEIKGQDPALEQISKAYAQTKTHDVKKPKVLMALGPSGAGKTFTAQVFAKLKAEGKFLEISGNEYNSHAGSLDYQKLLGGQGGTKGKDGELVTWVKATEGRGVLVINEGDKMHPDVWLKLMEFLNTGILRDKDGEVVQAKDLVIFITTNRGVSRMFPATAKNWTQEEIDARVRGFTQNDLRSYFLQKEGLKDTFNLPVEVLNRIDEWLAYGPVTKEAAIAIATAESDSLSSQYKDKFTVDVTVDADVLKHIALTGFDVSIDAREVRKRVARIYQTMIEDALDELALVGQDKILVKLVTNEKRQVELQLSANGKSFNLPAPADSDVDPLTDPVLVKRLLELEKEMQKEVIGQNQAINQVADAVVAHSSRSTNARPFVAYLGGVSGNGKTETGRALAKARYGSLSAIQIIPMGNIQDQAGFDTIFGGPAQNQGGDVERLFEKALREMPKGGVIVLDEISNMGGKNPAMKESLLMKLYDIFEEGRYISPIDGRQYDLGKYHFVLTGNDGENLFRGISSDDLLLETWKDNKSPDKVREMLLKSGWPAALLNRISVKALMKPLLSSEIDLVTQKLWNRQVSQFTGNRHGLEVNLADGFIHRLGGAFFSPDQGGRGMRDVLENNVESILAHSLMASGIDLTDLRGIKILVNIEDNKTSKPYITNATPKREVKFTTTVLKDGKPIHSEMRDVADFATQQVLLNSEAAVLVAFHEAGHAVANDEELTGDVLRFITIRGGKTPEVEYYGYASYMQSLKAAGKNPGYDEIVARIARLWAGRKAQELAGFKPDAGWSNDLKKIRFLAGKTLTTWGLDNELIGLQIDKDGNPVVTGPHAKLYLERLGALLKEAETMAERSLKARWPLVRAVAAELLFKGQITQDRFFAIESRFKNSRKKILTSAERGAERRAREYRGQALRCEDIFTPVE